MGILAMALLQRSPSARVGIPLMMGWTALFGWLRHWWAAYWGALVVGAALLLGWALRGWRRRFLPRWIVYAFYPVHLTIIGLVLAAWTPEPAEEPAIPIVQEYARPVREDPPQAQACDSRSCPPERRIGQAQRQTRRAPRTDARLAPPERPGSNPKVRQRVPELAARMQVLQGCGRSWYSGGLILCGLECYVA
jgi:hypothetical protein